MWARSAVGGFFSIICKMFKTLDLDFFILFKPFNSFSSEMCEERTRLLCRTPAWEHEGDYTVFNLSYNTTFVLQSLLFHTNSIWCIYQFIKYHIKSMHMWLIDYQTCVLLPNSIRHLEWICSAYFIIWVTLHKLKIILSYLTPSWSGCALVSVWPLVSLFVLAGFRAHMWSYRSSEIPRSLNSFPETVWKTVLSPSPVVQALMQSFSFRVSSIRCDGVVTW